MKNRISLSLFSAAALMATLFTASCVKHDVEEPPVGGEIVTNVVANTTIAELKASHIAGSFDTIKLDKIIKATVTADDRSGNFYKSLYVQDETGGIELLLNVGSLYTSYPIGRVVYVKLQGLIIGDYQDIAQIGGYVFDNTLGGIEPADVQRKVLKGELNKPITPRSLSIGQITPADWSTLVTLTGVEFADLDVNKYFADYIGKATTNRTLQDCNGSSLTFRSSGYANFAPQLTPGGKGTVTGILSAYNGDPQIYIRDINDVQLAGARCDGGSGAPPIFNLDFESHSTGIPVTVGGWVNYTPVAGGRTWGVKKFGSNTYAEIEAYQDSQPTTEAWLVTPSFSISTEKTLTFQSAIAYWKHDGLQVMYSTNFNGTDPTAASWTPLSPTLPGSSSTNFAMIKSGAVKIPAGSGNAVVAFKYTGTKAANTTKVQVDNIKLQ